jgi:hypothetical protein
LVVLKEKEKDTSLEKENKPRKDRLKEEII